ncbi:Trafficking protein particle complex subunit 12 [Cladochytrium tenue]|nr:Trafficking protein particle complex subunit 12 [Cladochytrium tenue]
MEHQRALSIGDLNETDATLSSSLGAAAVRPLTGSAASLHELDLAADSIPNLLQQPPQPLPPRQPTGSQPPLPLRISTVGTASGNVAATTIAASPTSVAPAARGRRSDAPLVGPASPTRAAAAAASAAATRSVAAMRGVGASLASSLKIGGRSRSPSVGPLATTASTATVATSAAAHPVVLDDDNIVAGASSKSIAYPRAAAPSPVNDFFASVASTSHTAAAPPPPSREPKHLAPSQVTAGANAAIAEFGDFSDAYAPPTIAGGSLLAALPFARWTDPATFLPLPTSDAVADAVIRAFPAGGAMAATATAARHSALLTAADAERVHGPRRALAALLRARAWRAAAELARIRLVGLTAADAAAVAPADLPSAAQALVDDIMQLWLVRLVALERLRRADVARAELARLDDFDAPALRYDAYPQLFPSASTATDRRGSMVSFELRVFAARLPALLGSPADAVARLYRLVLEAKRKSLNCQPNIDAADVDAGAQWRARASQLQLLIATLYADMKDFRLAVAVLDGVARAHPRDPDLHSALARMYLQYGNVDAARSCFDRVERLLAPVPQAEDNGGPADAPGADTADAATVDAAGSATDPAAAAAAATALPRRPDLVHANRAFAAMSAGEWASARGHLFAQLDARPGRAGAASNLAAAQLYAGSVGRALASLESLAVELPAVAANSPHVLFNLATLFDLVDASADRKRRALVGVVAPAAGDDLDPACLKL